MKRYACLVLAGLVALLFPRGFAQDQKPGGGEWGKRVAVSPTLPRSWCLPATKVGIFTAGLDTPSSATVDKDGNVWVVISGPLFGGPDPTDPAAYQGLRQRRSLPARDWQGVFTTVMNEIGYCPENGLTYIPEYGEKIWEIDGVNGELRLIVKDLFMGDHRNGGVTCKDGYLYFALGFPSNTGLLIRITMAGPTFPMTRSGSSTRTVWAPRLTIRCAETLCIPG